MAEPQDQSTVKLVDSKISMKPECTNKLMHAGQEMPSKIVTGAQKKIDGFRSLKAEINNDLSRINKTLDRVR